MRRQGLLAHPRMSWGIGRKTFTPLDIEGLQLWLDFSDRLTLFTDSAKTTPVTADGDVIGAAVDLSGNGHDAIQGTTANKPLFKTGIQNARGVARFDANDMLSVADFAYDLGEMSVFVVVDNGASGKSVMGHYDTGAGQRSWHIFRSSTGGLTDKMAINLSDDGSFGVGHRKWYDGSTDISGAAFRILEFTWNAGTLELFVNGVDETETKTIDDAFVAIHNSTAVISIGSILSSGAGIAFWEADIAEIIQYNTALPVADRLKVETYLNAKWGLF